MAKVGDKVLYRLYNGVEKKFYGNLQKAKLLKIDHTHYEGKSNRPYHVRNLETGYELWVSGKEFIRPAIANN